MQQMRAAVRELFCELANVSPEEQARILSERKIPGLVRAEVESLLRHDSTAEVFLSPGRVGDYAFYLSPEASSMAPGVLQRFHAVMCDPPPDLHRCTPMIL